MSGYHLAQLNLALPLEPLESELLAEFVAALDPVNAAADAAPGFVWRLQTEDGDATAIRGFGDDRLIINMSVWQSLEALRSFVYGGGGIHLSVMRRRREWFERMGQTHLVLWWVPLGHEPSLHEAEDRLDTLHARGPTPYAFTFRESFPAPDAALEHVVLDDRELCPS
jgi:hypothetical protein